MSYEIMSIGCCLFDTCLDTVRNLVALVSVHTLISLTLVSVRTLISLELLAPRALHVHGGGLLLARVVVEEWVVLGVFLLLQLVHALAL